jgi:hypothetical protein
MGVKGIWGQLPEAHRRWIVTRAIVATAVFNVIINVVTAWLGVQGQEEVPSWGAPLVETSIFWNLLGTLFLLPLITCALVTTAVRYDVTTGSLTSLNRLRSTFDWLAALPAKRLRRGLTLGVIAVTVLAPALILALAALGFPELTQSQFVLCQTAFAVTLGGLVTPIIALFAMADPPGDG